MFKQEGERRDRSRDVGYRTGLGYRSLIRIVLRLVGQQDVSQFGTPAQANRLISGRLHLPPSSINKCVFPSNSPLLSPKGQPEYTVYVFLTVATGPCTVAGLHQEFPFSRHNAKMLPPIGSSLPRNPNTEIKQRHNSSSPAALDRVSQNFFTAKMQKKLKTHQLW